LNPTRAANIAQAQLLAKNMKVNIGADFVEPAQARANLTVYYQNNTPLLNRRIFSKPECANAQKTTLDAEINQKCVKLLLKIFKV